MSLLSSTTLLNAMVQLEVSQLILQKQLENHKGLLKQMATTSCDCTLQLKISGNVDEKVNIIDEHIQISCDTSSCTIAFKSVVEDSSDIDRNWKEDIICSSDFDYEQDDIFTAFL
jgi:hypothetical protein